MRVRTNKAVLHDIAPVKGNAPFKGAANPYVRWLHRAIRQTHRFQNPALEPIDVAVICIRSKVSAGVRPGVSMCRGYCHVDCRNTQFRLNLPAQIDDHLAAQDQKVAADKE